MLKMFTESLVSSSIHCCVFMLNYNRINHMNSESVLSLWCGIQILWQLCTVQLLEKPAPSKVSHATHIVRGVTLIALCLVCNSMLYVKEIHKWHTYVCDWGTIFIEVQCTIKVTLECLWTDLLYYVYTIHCVVVSAVQQNETFHICVSWLPIHS